MTALFFQLSEDRKECSEKGQIVDVDKEDPCARVEAKYLKYFDAKMLKLLNRSNLSCRLT